MIERLSAHFTSIEFTKSSLAFSLGIDNEPPGWASENLRLLCSTILEPLRELWGVHIHVNSGWRCEGLNKATPGSSATSQHCHGEAADIVPGGIPIWPAFVMLCKSDIPYHQAIFEQRRRQDGGVNTWIHVSKAPGAEEPARKAMTKLAGEGYKIADLDMVG